MLHTSIRGGLPSLRGRRLRPPGIRGSSTSSSPLSASLLRPVLQAAGCALLVVLLAGATGARAATSPRDVLALLALHSEVKDRDGAWAAAMSHWPVHTCNAAGACGVDPCGEFQMVIAACHCGSSWPAAQRDWRPVSGGHH